MQALIQGPAAVAAGVDAVIVGLGVAAALAAVLLVLLVAVKSLLYICRPDQVLIFAGRKHTMPDGTVRGFRVIFGGRGWRVPIVESVDHMDLTVMEVPIRVRNAYTRGGIPLAVDAIANVKISSDPLVIGNAIERFLGRDREEVRRVAKETLEGHLRGVLATMTPEEVNEDRLKFGKELSHESEEDLIKLGIHLDTLKIAHVADEVKYLDSIGREAIANVVMAAEIAESDAKREAEQSEAANAGRARVTQANVEAQIAQMQNDLRRIRAELESQVKSEEERCEAAAREARARAEQELQAIRAQLEQVRLQADQVLPAEAQRQAREYWAQGEAAAIRERGNAMARVLELWNQAWLDAGEDALRIHLIQELEKTLMAVAAGVKRITVENVSLIDAGDGQTLTAYLSAYPAMLASVFDSVRNTIGIDIPAIISGRDRPVPANRPPERAPSGLYPRPTPPASPTR